MAITVVAGQEDSFGDFTGATATTVTLTFPGNWTAGNGILASVLWYPAAAQTVTVAAGSNSGVASTESNDGTFHIKQFHIKNLSGTPGATVVFTFSAATGFVVCHATEITGQDTATQPDAAGVGQAQSGISNTANAVSSGSITTVSTDAFLYGFSVITSAGGMSALDPGTSFTAFPDVIGDGGSLSQLGLAEYATRAAAGGGAVTMTATGASGSSAFLTTAIAIKAAAAGSVTRTPSVGALALAGLAVTVAVTGSVTRTPSVGTLALTGNAATVTASGGHARTPSVGALTLTGLQPVQTLTVAAPITGELTFSGGAATVLRGSLVQPAAGALTLTGNAPSLLNARTISPSVGTLTLTGLQASVSVGVVNTHLIPLAGAISINGLSPTLTYSSPLIRPSVGSMTLSGLVASVLSTSGRAYVGGTAVTETGVMITDFLSDATPVPATRVMLGGIAHTQDGFRYVAEWPSSNQVFYNAGRAIRTDGAMVVAASGTIAAFCNGIALTFRGETLVSTSAPQLIHNGVGLRQDGSLCVSEAA